MTQAPSRGDEQLRRPTGTRPVKQDMCVVRILTSSLRALSPLPCVPLCRAAHQLQVRPRVRPARHEEVAAQARLDWVGKQTSVRKSLTPQLEAGGKAPWWLDRFPPGVVQVWCPCCSSCSCGRRCSGTRGYPHPLGVMPCKVSPLGSADEVGFVLGSCLRDGWLGIAHQPHEYDGGSAEPLVLCPPSLAHVLANHPGPIVSFVFSSRSTGLRESTNQGP